MCGLLGHSERDCAVVYANPSKVIEKSYEVLLRTPNKQAKNLNLGAKWLRNGPDGGQTWLSGERDRVATSVQGEEEMVEIFMDTDGVMTEVPGTVGIIKFK